MYGKFFKILFSFVIISFLTGVFISNYNLYHKTAFDIINNDSIPADLIKELHALEIAFSNHADDEMQNLYPEGYIFMNALYGLAWCNTLEKINPQSDFFLHGQKQIQQAFNRINSEKGRSIFDETLPLEYGAFYTGWSTYLLGRKLTLEPLKLRNSDEADLFKEQCEKIASALIKQTFPASYHHGIWPADAMLCAASLALHDSLFEKKYADTLDTWITRVKSSLDENGLIPHAVDSGNRITENARGSSISLMLIFLGEIDPQFARQQFEIYKNKFVDSRLGLTGIREYAKGDFGLGDVDSGPVIFQMGAAATIVGMQTLHIGGDYKTSNQVRSTLEACGFPVSNGPERFYVFRQLPMADAFIVWGHSSMKNQMTPDERFMKFHLYSIGLSLVLLVALAYTWKRKA